ncbi:MAG: hypothetical protein WC943_06865 [Elusimicrobiota bacterium]|jgi:hypothetical protein
MKTVLRLSIAASVLFLTSSASALDPIRVCEIGQTCTPYGQQGIIDFAKDYESNPRDLHLYIFEHAFSFDVGPGTCGANCTSLRFQSAEMGVDKTFTGANTAEVSRAFQDYVKSESFLKAFIRLINMGAGQVISGSPAATIGTLVRAGFQDTLFSNIKTMEEKSGAAPGRDPAVSASYGQFKDSGYKGKVFSFAPGFSLDFGEHKDKKLKFTIPLSQIDMEGLKTYRAGIMVQYQHPFYLPGNVTVMVGPGLSYSAMGSADLPNFSGIAGGALAATANKDWKSVFATVGGYYGGFKNMGGIDTSIRADVFGWGLQTGYRFGKRWVAAVYGVGIQESVRGFNRTTYHTAGASLSYKIFNRFNVTGSAQHLFGLSNRQFAEFGLGSAWFF